MQQEQHGNSYNKNNNSNKIRKSSDLKRRKAKKALEKSTNFPKIAKITRIFSYCQKQTLNWNVPSLINSFTPLGCSFEWLEVQLVRKALRRICENPSLQLNTSSHIEQPRRFISRWPHGKHTGLAHPLCYNDKKGNSNYTFNAGNRVSAPKI